MGENIWDNFLRPVSPVDVWKLISSLPSKTSPGWDMVDHDMLRIACQPSQHCRVSFVLRMITKLTNRCIGNSFFPRYGKKGVTIMIPKKKKNATSVYNMRPITMFPIVTNLIVRIITERFVSLIQEHGLLHVNNRGFIKGGNTAQCIDTVLDLIEECWESNLLHMVKLDIRKAYDSVQFFHVRLALQRLCAPPKIVQLFLMMVEGGTRRIRTAYGFTKDVRALRSLGQGMSCSAPIFAACVDPLHEQLPTDSQQFYLKHHLWDLLMTLLYCIVCSQV